MLAPTEGDGRRGDGKSRAADEDKSGTGKKKGRPPALKEEHREVLRDIEPIRKLC